MPTKIRLTVMVDMDVAQYFKKKYDDEVIKQIKERERVISFSEYMNKVLKEYIRIKAAKRHQDN